ncbi:hypothetical protein M5689_008910 [Euphorbia peplus]|nr:hypothetical protein M5689_008910 [Euphorbia peplus]
MRFKQTAGFSSFLHRCHPSLLDFFFSSAAAGTQEKNKIKHSLTDSDTTSKTKKMKKTNQKDATDSKDQQWSFRNIMKDVENFGKEHMTWKEKKEMENRRVVSLGGKPPKKQRLPLSVARVQMKKQKEREEKIDEENMILGRFGARFSSRGSNKRSMERRKPEDRVLKSSVGHFKNGVLDVKHMLNGSSLSRGTDITHHMVDVDGKKMYKGKRKPSQGKKRGGGGGGKKRH